MSIQPYDKITEEEKLALIDYITEYAGAKPQDLNKILTEWNKNKKSYFRKFGNKLRVKLPVHVAVDEKYKNTKISNLYQPPTRFEITHPEKIEKMNHEFIIEFMKHMSTLSFELETLTDVVRLFSYQNIRNNILCSDIFISNPCFDKILKLPKGTKTMRAIRKMLEFVEFPRMELFNRWRDDLSAIYSNKDFDTNLVFSIHPLDFLTLSDNDCNWSSCFSWKKNGCHSRAVIETLNSNNCVIAYLEDTEQPIMKYKNYNCISNKCWRTLVFVDKDIMLVGKHYPCTINGLNYTILEELTKILKYKYQYNKERYYDNCGYDDYSDNCIFFETETMYNDIENDTDNEYYCNRNYIPHQKRISLSGPSTCVCCGEKFESYGCMDKLCNKCYMARRCSIDHEVKEENYGKIYQIKYQWLYHSYDDDNKVYCNHINDGYAMEVSRDNLIRYFYFINELNRFTRKESLKEVKMINNQVKCDNFKNLTHLTISEVTEEVLNLNEVCQLLL